MSEKKLIIENPFDATFDRYKRIMFSSIFLFIILYLTMEVYFNVPDIDASVFLGDLYLIYMVISTLCLIVFAVSLFVSGMMAQVWVMKKATDLQLQQLGDFNAIFSEKKEEEKDN